VFRFFRREVLLDAPTRRWLLDLFAWALRNFGSDLFYTETALITPTDRHFPGRADSPEKMAQLILRRVQEHAGLGHWPVRLVPPEAFPVGVQPRLVLAGAIRGSRGVAVEPVDEAQMLTLTYPAAMVHAPEALIATFAHTLAHFLAGMADEPPPGGAENRAQATEGLAVFMGFGLMLANTAFQAPKGGCGSCQQPGAARSSALPEHDLTYALALFSTLKGIPDRAVLPHLKRSLRGYYKRAARSLRRDEAALAPLRAIDAPLPALP